MTGGVLIPSYEATLTVEARARTVVLSADAAGGFSVRLVLTVEEADALTRSLKDAATEIVRAGCSVPGGA